MLTSLKTLNRELRAYDSLLYAQETKLGRYDVYRKSAFGGTPPYFIFALTDDWKVTGRPVSWSVDVVLNRIKAHDLWRDDGFVERIMADNEKIQESKDRSFRTSIEGFLSEFRSSFAKATSDVNTSLLEKGKTYGHC